jgi:small basic protein
MAANDVQYVLTLKDNFNSVIREADANTNKLESSILHVGEAIGIAFGLHEIVSFGREILDNTAKFQGF